MAKKKPRKFCKPKRVSDENIGIALVASCGCVAVAARALGYSRSALWARVTKSPELQGSITDARESLCDKAESALNKKLDADDPELGAITFVLKTLGKSRGYTERTEVDHSEGVRVAGMSPDEFFEDLVDQLIGPVTED
ncbi:MAG: hypothetical protein HQ518_09295 [Rhodopirellula sp.]|nr:hypothetical protein [Rhodopirellula sp.]